MNEVRNLSDDNRSALLLEVHREIENVAKLVFESSKNYKYELVYPPGEKLTELELKAITELKNIPNMESALKKIISDSAANVVFHLLSIIDGVANPDFQNWKGVSLLDFDETKDESEIMLHDEFFSTYWEWKEKS